MKQESAYGSNRIWEDLRKEIQERAGDPRGWEAKRRRHIGFLGRLKEDFIIAPYWALRDWWDEIRWNWRWM